MPHDTSTKTSISITIQTSVLNHVDGLADAWERSRSWVIDHLLDEALRMTRAADKDDPLLEHFDGDALDDVLAK